MLGRDRRIVEQPIIVYKETNGIKRVLKLRVFETLELYEEFISVSSGWRRVSEYNYARINEANKHHFIGGSSCD